MPPRELIKGANEFWTLDDATTLRAHVFLPACLPVCACLAFLPGKLDSEFGLRLKESAVRF